MTEIDKGPEAFDFILKTLERNDFSGIDFANKIANIPWTDGLKAYNERRGIEITPNDVLTEAQLQSDILNTPILTLVIRSLQNHFWPEENQS